jgi:HlyD family secretion protein
MPKLAGVNEASFQKPDRTRRLAARLRPLAVPLLLAALVAVALWWRGRPPRVTVAVPMRRDVVTSVVTTGMVETVTVSPGSETGGRIERLLARQGQVVAAEEVLAVLDTRELAARAREAQAALAAARLKRRQAAPEAWQPQIEQAEAALAQARLKTAQAEQEWRDLQALADGGAVPRVQAETARYALRAARIGEQEAAARIAQIRRQAEDTRRQAAVGVEAAEAALATLRGQISRARITAPTAGIVIEIYARAGETLAPGAPLLKIARRDSLRIAVPLDEQYLAQVRPGQPVRLATDAFPRGSFAGKVEKIDPAVDPDRGTIKVIVAPETTPAFLRPEMTLDVNILTGRYPGMLTLPRTALDGTAAAPRVWVVDREGRAVPRPIEPGPSSDSASQDVPIRRGISPGDRVILNPSRLRPGQRVEIAEGN